MPLPRRIVPNTTYLLTRRCSQRQFLLVPSAKLTRLFIYAIGIAIAKTGVQLHAVVVMSNHWHAVVTDPNGNIPLFLAEVHRTVARARNAMLGRTENFWSNDQTSLVVLPLPADVIDKIAYVIANPVAAGAVENPKDWPGLISAEFGAVLEASRPESFFRNNGPSPANAQLRITAPSILVDGRADELQGLIDAAIAQKVQEAQGKMQTDEREFAGAEACQSQSSDRVAKTPETLGQRNPRVACGDPEKKKKLLAQLKFWLLAYREAYRDWRKGMTNVLFPEGTYGLRLYAGVPCVTPTLPA